MVLKNVAIMKEYTTICNAAPSEFLATIALRNRTKILQRNIDIINQNLPLYDAFLKNIPIYFRGINRMLAQLLL